MENVIIRKPTDDEQRNAKILTSDYLISALTIHSSILETLGFCDKVYRSKQSIVKASNKKLITKYTRNLSFLKKTFGAKKSPYDLYKFNEEIANNKKFINDLKTNNYTNWKQIGGKKSIPNFAKKYNTISSFLRAVDAITLFFEMFETHGMEMMTSHEQSKESLESLIPIFVATLNKCVYPSVYKHSQTIVWELAYKRQIEVEKEIGKGFSPKKYAEFYLSPSDLEKIKNLWEIDLLTYEGSWDELCDYLYSPNIISKIRKGLGVNVRSRSSLDARKGVEVNDKKKFLKLIEEQKSILGQNFSKKEEELKITELENKKLFYKSKYSEAKLLKKYSSNEDRDFAIKEVEKYKNKYYYYKSAHEKAVKELNKKIKAADNLEIYTSKHNLIKEIIEETRSADEIYFLEQQELEDAIRKQKSEKSIPYYTWRFVCDKIDKDTALKIEDALEVNLNKGSGVNGEDGYINVTSFPMSKSYEFFVDYPKSSSMFKAFKKKGKELAKILIDGVAHHLGINFVCCDGETFVNNPMEKTMNGDMLDWIGV